MSPTDKPKTPPASSGGGLQLETPPATKASSQALMKNEATLPEQVTRRGIAEAQWRTLCNSLFPGANPNSVLNVWDYCVARRLDPMKKPCHIVPMEVTVKLPGGGDRKEWRDVVLPGIYEHRTTAQRTGFYLGHSEATFGTPKKMHGVEAPEYCSMTMYRWNEIAKMRAEFPVTVRFSECVALKSGGQANARWSRAPIQMLTKCTEAAGLREAFPDELGGQQTAEEMEGQRHVDADIIESQPSLPKPEKFDDWLIDLKASAETGIDAFTKAWAESAPALRDYLTQTDADYYETLKGQAMGEIPF